MQNMLETQGDSIEGKTAVISGSGNVATHAAEKVVQLGGKVLTLSDSKGYLHDPAGMDQDKIDWIKNQKGVVRGSLADYTAAFAGSSWHEGETPWGVACDIALPCATQNEMDQAGAELLVANGCIAVSEGANMPVNLDGVKVFKAAGILYAPGKASNAGGVAVSGLEMSQNSGRVSWSEEQLQDHLRSIMKEIHDTCATYGAGRLPNGGCDYVKGANIAGFVKVADAMLAFGVV